MYAGYIGLPVDTPDATVTIFSRMTILKRLVVANHTHDWHYNGAPFKNERHLIFPLFQFGGSFNCCTGTELYTFGVLILPPPPPRYKARPSRRESRGHSRSRSKSPTPRDEGGFAAVPSRDPREVGRRSRTPSRSVSRSRSRSRSWAGRKSGGH